MIKKYEIMYIVDQDVKEADLKKLTSKMDAILTNADGKIIETNAWGLKDFAYEINHKKKGYYFVQIVETTPENILEFERVSKIDHQIVRTMVINTEKDSEYIQSTELSKTDMSKFEEERREKRTFKRPDRNYDAKNVAPKKTEPKSSEKTETATKTDSDAENEVK